MRDAIVPAATDDVEHLRFMLEEITTPPVDLREEMSSRGINLRKAEARILGTLLAHKGRPMSRSGLMAAAFWDRQCDEWPQEKIVDVYMTSIRKKLPPDVTIRTIWGYGYIAEAVQ